MTSNSRRLAIALGLPLAGLTLYAVVRDASAQSREWHESRPRQHNSKYRVHDLERPKPIKITPAEKPGGAPSDAVVLFDGTDTSKWEKPNGDAAEWVVRDGYMEVNATGSIRTKEKFGDCQIHVEWRNPSPPAGRSQTRGNSGVIFMAGASQMKDEKRSIGGYEFQVLDNYDNPTYSDGYAGAVYGQHPPLVNACLPSGEWQTYDIVFKRPRFDSDGNVVEPGRFTGFHNGVLVQHNAEIYGPVVWGDVARYVAHEDSGHLLLQDHGDKQAMRFRNIWIRPLDLSPGE